MKRTAGFAAAAVIVVGCTPSPPRPAAENLPASVQGPPAARGYLGSVASAERTGDLPSIPWPKFQAGPSARADEAAFTIILRGHELHDRYPAASASELAEMLVRDAIWEQNAKLVPLARRTAVAQEALGIW